MADEWAAMSAVFDGLRERAAELAGQVAAELVRQIPDYLPVSAGQLEPGIGVSIVAGLTAVSERRLPTAGELAEIAALADLRARQGLPLEAVLQAYRVGARTVWAEAAAGGRERGVPAEILLQTAERTWEWVDQVTTQAAAAHRRAELLQARYHHQHRADFIFGALNGTLTRGELAEQAARYGLLVDGTYAALTARPTAGHSTYELDAELDASASTPLLLAARGEELLGILAARLTRPVACGRVALGPAVALAALPTSHRVASTVMTAMLRFALDGPCTLEQVRLRAAVATQDDLTALIEARIAAPLRGSRLGDRNLLETLEAYMAHGLNVERAAHALFVHPNTVRYRLSQVERLTGIALDRLEDLVEVWWLLQHRRMSGAPEKR